MDGAPLDPAAAVAAGKRLAVDQRTATVVTALRAAGVEPVLLKGPAVGRWLYTRPDERGYRDIDLLVAPGDRVASEAVLADLGYERVVQPPAQVRLPDGVASHADTWDAPGQPVPVDLHRCLHHTEQVPAGEVWNEVWRDHGEIVVAGTPVAVPAPRVLALHVVLHLQPRDVPGSRAWTDLARAVVVVDRPVWDDVKALAQRFGVDGELGALLSLVRGGAELAADLELGTEPSAELLQQHRRHAPTLTRLRRRLWGASPTEVAHVLARMVSPARVRQAASDPDRGLIRAYAERAAAVPPAVRDWARHRRAGPGRLR